MLLESCYLASYLKSHYSDLYLLLLAIELAKQWINFYRSVAHRHGSSYQVGMGYVTMTEQLISDVLYSLSIIMATFKLRKKSRSG